jgi:hypothetical protein
MDDSNRSLPLERLYDLPVVVQARRTTDQGRPAGAVNAAIMIMAAVIFNRAR